ncbi:MAG: hypothetical protein D3914_17155 [Candidatus Electrothrix sp. LOE2]|jgi:hypothetical protein|nr:hypothetical protein [Candidatus Electrothrix sp. LOE2]
MNAKQKARWAKRRVPGKAFYIRIVGGFMGGLFTVVMTLSDLWRGRSMTFDSFLLQTVFGYVFYGIPIAWVTWESMEKKYRKALQEDEES